jgi:hypothetical protein
MKVISTPQSGQIGNVVYVNFRYGQLARQYVRPRNPRTPEQQRNRGNFGAVSSRWRALTPEQRAAWCMAAADKFMVTHSGHQVPLNGYNYFVWANTRRADLGLPQFDLPPVEPTFSPNPVAELVATNTKGTITLELRVPSPPAQYTLVQGAAPVSTGVRCVQHFPFLGLLPPPNDGWSDSWSAEGFGLRQSSAAFISFISAGYHWRRSRFLWYQHEPGFSRDISHPHAAECRRFRRSVRNAG